MTLEINKPSKTQDPPHSKLPAEDHEFPATASLLDRVSDAIITTDMAFVILGWNQAAERIYGWTAGEVLGQPLETLILAEYTGTTREKVLDQFTAHDVWQGEVIQQHRNGRRLTILSSVNLVRNAANEPIGIIAINRDFTEQKQVDQKLAELAAIVQFSDDAIIGKTLDGIITSWNKGAERLYGYGADEVLSQPISLLVPPGHPDEVPQILQRIRSGEQVETYETVRRRKDGQRIDVLLRVSPVRDADGRIFAASVIARDNTARKQAADALWQSEERFRTTFEQAAVGIAHIAPDGHFLLINQRFCDLLGYTRTEIQTKTFQEITHPADLNADLEQVRQMLGHEIDSYTMEKRYFRKDHTVQWIQLTVAITWHEDGTPKYFISVVEDIAERKQSEAALHRYTERLAAINRLDRIISSGLDFGQVYDSFVQELTALVPLDRTAIVLLNESGDHWQVTRQWTRYPPANVIGSWFPVTGSVFEWLMANQKPFVELEIGKDSTWPAETESLRREGLRARMLVPIIMRERVVGAFTAASRREASFSVEGQTILVTIADKLAIALQNSRLYDLVRGQAAELEQRVMQRTAELEASNKELEAFSYSVSHDLRAPLRAIDGFSRILVEDYAPELSPEARRYLQRVREGAQQMGHLIDHLLNFSRLGRQSLKRQPVVVADVVHRVLGELLPTYDGRQVDFTIGELPPCQADPTLLHQVFANLLGNAVKFTKTRRQAVIEVGCRDRDGELVYFVRDNGVGFDMQYANKLFGVFQRLHRAEDYEGTGVGLATVQRIIHRHGGRIWAEAETDTSATFYFTLGGVTADDK